MSGRKVIISFHNFQIVFPPQSAYVSFYSLNICIYSTGMYPLCMCKEPLHYSKEGNLCNECPEDTTGKVNNFKKSQFQTN